METDAVKVTRFGQVDEIEHGERRFPGEELHDDGAPVGIEVGQNPLVGQLCCPVVALVLDLPPLLGHPGRDLFSHAPAGQDFSGQLFQQVLPLEIKYGLNYHRLKPAGLDQVHGT